jgi:hypothetical protein
VKDGRIFRRGRAMGINQAQFQKGLSMAAFLEQFGTEDKCHAALVALRWRNGFLR